MTDISAPFTTTTGDKQTCRQHFINAVREHIPNPVFFILPSSDAHDAQMIWKEWGPDVPVYGVERDPDICDSIRRNFPRIRIEESTVGGYVRTMAHRRDHEFRKPPTFNAVFLDYMGAAKNSDITDIRDLVAHMTGEKLVLAITFSKSPRGKYAMVETFVRENAWMEEEEEYDEDNGWNTSVNLANAICAAIELNGLGRELRTLDLLHAYEYRDREGSTMMHFILLYLERFSGRR